MNAAAATAEMKPDQTSLTAKFASEYGEALDAARVSAEHTATEGWQELYGAFRKQNRERRNRIAGELATVAKTVEAGHYGEDDEKNLGDLKKQLQELRVEAEIFDDRTVLPVREPVDICCQVIQCAIDEAHRLEERAPLIHKGVVDEIQRAVACVEKPEWDIEKGMVVIR